MKSVIPGGIEALAVFALTLISLLQSALSSHGVARYGHAKTQENALWDDVNAALAPIWARVQKVSPGGYDLLPLNPTVGTLT